MDTNIQTLDETNLVDLFGTGSQDSVKNGLIFGQEQINTNILETVPPVNQEDKSLPDPAATPEKDKVEQVDPVDPEKQTDILDSPKAGRKPKYDFSDISGYFQDRIKNKKFVAIEEEDAEGNKTMFVPKTPEEFDEVIDIQVNYKLQQERKALEQKVYDGKSPAWKAVIQYAEMVDDPTQIIPFLQGVKNIQSVSNLNPDEIDGAEQIIRTRLEQRGDPEEAIEAQIESLKTTDKLIATAKQYKPVILQQEQQALSIQIQEQKRREQEYEQMVSSIRDNAVKAIEQPIFGKTKLKQEEKAAIYDLIAEPSVETQGYGIYTAIDQMFDKGDFETLRQIALLIAKKDAFYSYMGTSVANNTAASLQKKLTVAGDSRSSSGNDFNQDDSPVVKRNQFSNQVRFGK